MDKNRTYEIDRIRAGKMLGVTTRTIDRYVEKGQIRARKIHGRIRMCEEDVLNLKEGTPVAAARKNAISITPRKDDTNFYKDLYEETIKVLDEKEKKLEQSNYRIGQLESQITSRFPVKMFEAETSAPAIEALRQSLEFSEKSLENLKRQLESERLNRKIIAIILYILLLLQPVLWYFLQAGNY